MRAPISFCLAVVFFTLAFRGLSEVSHWSPSVVGNDLSTSPNGVIKISWLSSFRYIHDYIHMLTPSPIKCAGTLTEIAYRYRARPNVVKFEYRLLSSLILPLEQGEVAAPQSKLVGQDQTCRRVN
jgi:hypothetical protein